MGQTIVTAPDGKKYRVTHPDGATNEEIQKQLQANLGQAAPQAEPTWSDEAVGAVKGLGKGLVGDVVGAGQIAEAVPGTREMIDRIPGARAVAHRAKEFATSDDATAGETAGRWVGGMAPFIAGAFTGVDEAAAGPYIAARLAPYAGRFTGPLSELAANAGFGAAGGAAQPTKSGSLGSHALNAATGAVAGGVTAPPIAGRVAQAAGAGLTWQAISHLARLTGQHPLEVLAEASIPGSLFGLSSLARRAGHALAPVGRAIGNYLPAGAAGATAGQVTRGATESDDERSQ